MVSIVVSEMESDEHDDGAACETVNTTGECGDGLSLPRVVKFGYTDFKSVNGKWSAMCNTCKKTMSDKVGVSSSFTK